MAAAVAIQKVFDSVVRFGKKNPRSWFSQPTVPEGAVDALNQPTRNDMKTLQTEKAALTAVSLAIAAMLNDQTPQLRTLTAAPSNNRKLTKMFGDDVDVTVTTANISLEDLMDIDGTQEEEEEETAGEKNNGEDDTHFCQPNLLNFLRADMSDKSYFPFCVVYDRRHPRMIFVICEYRNEAPLYLILGLYIAHEADTTPEQHKRHAVDPQNIASSSAAEQNALNPLQSLGDTHSDLRFIPTRYICEAVDQAPVIATAVATAADDKNGGAARKKRKVLSSYERQNSSDAQSWNFKYSVPWSKLNFYFVGHQIIPTRIMPRDCSKDTTRPFDM